VLQVVLQNGWKEVLVHRVGWRSHLGSFSVNAGFNDPVPVDDRYGVDGLALKQPMSEGDNPGRLIIDNTARGNIDVVDLNPAGTAAARLQRYSYRDPTAGGWNCNEGNSLALETRHETLAADDLADTDILYISDQNRKEYGTYVSGYVSVLGLNHNHPLQDLNVEALPDVNLREIQPFMSFSHGIATAGSRDILYVACACQSFEHGFLGEVDTTDNQWTRNLDLLYADEGFVHVDWYDPRRVFVGTFDGFYNDPDQALYLHLIYDGVVVDTLRLVVDYVEYEGLRGMAFDPYLRRLYLTVGTSVMVVEVNYGADAAPMPSAPPVTVVGEISTWGGSLNAPDGSVELDFYYGTLDETTVVTYTTDTDAMPTGDLFGMRFFDLSAATLAAGTPVTTFDPPYVITIHYTDTERAGAKEDSLKLYWWNGSQWTLELTSSVDPGNNVLTATPNHMSLFAVLGETERVFLPLALR
jgi:hypothetical protein